MVIQVVIPKIGDTGSEVVLDRWMKQVGDEVHEGEPLLELSTDKAAIEIEAPGSGILRMVRFENGSILPEGEVVGLIANADDDLSTVDFVEAPGDQPALELTTTSSTARSRLRGRIASPRAQSLARDNQMSQAMLTAITGSGTNGRILARDVDALISGYDVPGHDIPFTAAQRIMAERMTQSATIPQFSVSLETDVTRLLQRRQALNTEPSATKISVTAMLLVLIAQALQQYPRLNATCAGNSIHVWEAVNLGVAVSSQGNLLVPVLKDCERKTIREIAEELSVVTECARQGVLTSERLHGGTFTVSNLGMLGIDDFQPLLNPPQAGILAVGRIAKRPWVDNDGVLVARETVRLTLTADHRVVDGAYAAAFLSHLCALLANLNG